MDEKQPIMEEQLPEIKKEEPRKFMKPMDEGPPTTFW